jgi:hypothetical protein
MFAPTGENVLGIDPRHAMKRRGSDRVDEPYRGRWASTPVTTSRIRAVIGLVCKPPAVLAFIVAIRWQSIT